MPAKGYVEFADCQPVVVYGTRDGLYRALSAAAWPPSDIITPTHVTLTRQELAAFVLGTRSSAAGDALTELDGVLDRSHLMPAAARESVLVPKPGMKISDDLEH